MDSMSFSIMYIQRSRRRALMMMMTETTKTPRRQQQRREDINISSRCSGCAALTSEHRALQQRVEMLQRQLRATANLQHLLAAKDRELAVCRARLEQYEGRRTTASCEEDVQEASEATTPVHEHKTSKYIGKQVYYAIIAYDKRNNYEIRDSHSRSCTLCFKALYLVV